MKWYLCSECFNVFRSENIKIENTWAIPCVLACCGGYMFEIDEEMIDPIRTLNMKGYATDFCCAGHAYDGSGAGGYVSFNVDFVPNLESLPKGWYRCKYSLTPTIRYDFKKESCYTDRVKTVHKKIEALMKWSDELPANFEW